MLSSITLQDTNDTTTVSDFVTAIGGIIETSILQPIENTT